ncbi:uncharacterized protein BO95DRAFT_430333 [Aspergillus brunneoviolaceus CBS 621.78]|uniref:Uncharacterized protein n=1 Tax=Aspergillus brunneoviolaceus CBS 621.78 TaxID=1450534 RepID=A0ACD1GDP1_9EURO|nr:hypothetical protein BO95DRAFT_430333 [Aspergillus brunneoviolaceus CBS 621.78]RAH47360.1 hypothetical protein BO95DRAFT_430333 [Aspergillus brunneoviolaceus CBS 621.78]
MTHATLQLRTTGNFILILYNLSNGLLSNLTPTKLFDRIKISLPNSTLAFYSSVRAQQPEFIDRVRKMCCLVEFFLRASIEPVMIRRECSLERDGRWREAQTLRRRYYTMTFSWLYDFEPVGELIRAEKQLVFLAQKEEFFRECERRCLIHLEINLCPDESLIEKLQTAQRLSSEVRQTLCITGISYLTGSEPNVRPWEDVVVEAVAAVRGRGTRIVTVSTMGIASRTASAVQTPEALIFGPSA